MDRFQNLDVAVVLPDDRAGIATDEGITSEMFAAFDGFEQERFARAPDFAVGREGCFDIGEEPARDGNEISVRGEFQKLFESGGVHEIRWW